MTHLMVEPGGEIYIPYARSRLKALLALNLRHISQKFQVDGSTIEVRIVGDQHFIRITGGKCSFKMDSGLIDVELYAIDTPENYRAGVYADTARVATYNAAFTKDSPPAPATATKKLNPGDGSAGQFSGDVSKGMDFKGAIPVSTTPRSFSPGKEEVLVGSVMTTADVERDVALFFKKYTAMVCPASTFTGRARLYAQAMYGAHMYAKFTAGEAPLRPPFGLSNKTFQYQPVLTLTALEHNDKDADGLPITYPSVDLNTSSGVYLDTSTGNHWLFNIADHNWDVYPLIADACGEAARKFLKSGSGITGDDLHHLEAYILSTCRPDSKKKQTAAFSGSVPSGSTCGYGWHWNYSGTICDIAVTRIKSGESVGNGRINRVLESTHLSTSFTKADTGSTGVDDFKYQWIASMTTVSGPSIWCTVRNIWEIIHTTGSTMERLIPDSSGSTSGVMPYPGTGTFYVFYRGDERQICKVQVEYIEAITDDWTRYTSSNTSEIWRTPFYISMNIRTYRGTGFIETYPECNAHFKTTHTIGNATIGPQYSLKIDSGGVRKEVFGGSLGAYTPSVFTTAISAIPGEPYPYPYPYVQGDPMGPPGASYYNRVTVPSTGYKYGGGHSATVRIRTSTYQKLEWGRSTIVIPQGDAEAIFTRDDQWTETKLQGAGDEDIYPEGDSEYVPQGPDGDGSPIYHTGWFDAELMARSARVEVPDSTVTTNTVSERKLHCSAGAIDTLAAFDVVVHDAENNGHDDFIPYVVNVVSGTRPDSPVLSKSFISPQGTSHDPAYPHYPVLVGWV